jgi:dTDP-4-dehydrorhamnose reductase
MKLLITGASGLLGSDVNWKAEQDGIKTVKVCLKPRDGFLSADISSPQGIEKIDGADWDAMIHCAAWRDPNICEKDENMAKKINADATGNLAELAKKRNAKFLYISTDYVFPGTNPPYKETDETRPVNWYGQTKLMGEKNTFRASEKFCVLRIPALYGVRAGLEASPLLLTTLQALKSNEPWNMEDSIIKYPTCTEDVAEAALFLLNKNASGIFQFSGQDKTTRLSFTHIMAEATGANSENIHAITAPPETDATRPKDAHLDISRILSLGFSPPMPLIERLKKLYQDGFLSI